MREVGGGSACDLVKGPEQSPEGLARGFQRCLELLLISWSLTYSQCTNSSQKT